MSFSIVEVCRIDAVLPHQGADKLSLAIIKGWQVVIKKDEYKAGDIIIFIEPNSSVPANISDKYDFTKYLSNGRVKIARLRGEPSHGVLIPNFKNWPIGTNVAEELGIKKWYPPAPKSAPGGGGKSHMEKEHPLFPCYTDIQNMRHYPDILLEGEEVVITEKLHGTNQRSALIQEDGNPIKMAGSRKYRRKEPRIVLPLPWYKRFWNKLWSREPLTMFDFEFASKDWFWFPWTVPEIITLMLNAYLKKYKQFVLFGEVFGGNVQNGVRYGSPDSLDFMAFDVLIDGKYQDFDVFSDLCFKSGVKAVPVLYRGPFSLDKVKELSFGKTTVGGDNHIREGVVVRPVKERTHPKIGRVILKWVSDDFLEAKNIGDFEDS